MAGSRARLVSVIMPAWRAEAVIGRAIASVRAQGWMDWELLVVDDASPDATSAAAQQAAGGDPRVRLLRQERNGGAAEARNAAIALARGRYLAFLDADDEWLPDKLARQLDVMDATGAGLCYTGFWRCRAGAPPHEVRVPARIDHAGLLRGNVIGCLTAVVDRERHPQVAMPALRRRQDYALWLSLLRGGGEAVGLQAPLARYHVAPGSLSSNRLAGLADTWAVYRRHEGLGRGQAAMCLASHLAGRLRRG